MNYLKFCAKKMMLSVENMLLSMMPPMVGPPGEVVLRKLEEESRAGSREKREQAEKLDRIVHSLDLIAKAVNK